MSSKIERRLLPGVGTLPIQVRADGDKMKCSGYAAVFYNSADPGTEYELFEGYKERVMPGCFSRAMQEDDVRALFNHDVNCLLGRTKGGTCRLSVDAKGLRYDIDLPDTELGKAVRVACERGDLSGSSFSFIPRSVKYVKNDDGTTTREVHDVQLFDVGPVTFPAYEATTAGCRAIGDTAAARGELLTWMEAQQAPPWRPSAGFMRMRQRLAEVA